MEPTAARARLINACGQTITLSKSSIDVSVELMAFSAPPITLVIALAMDPNPAERMAQQGLGMIWPSEDCGMVNTAINRTATHTIFFARSVLAKCLSASRTDVVFISPQRV